jgi:hypothetical protein
MKSFEFDHDTLLNGSPITVVLSVRHQWGEDYPIISLDSIWFDGNNVMAIINPADLDSLQMEAESALHESANNQ